MSQRSIAYGVLFLLATAAPALAQTWNFDDGTTQGWAVQSSDSWVRWKVGGFPGWINNEAPWVSSPYSLNYNNALTYESTDAAGSGTPNHGSVTSPSFDLTDRTSPQVTFSCRLNIEDDGVVYDQNWFQILKMDGQFGVPVMQGILAGGDFGTACSASWHTHTIALLPEWGTVRISLRFDTVDNVANADAGWFIDDVQITPDPVAGWVSPDDDDDSSGGCQGRSGIRNGWSFSLPVLCGLALLACLRLHRRSI